MCILWDPGMPYLGVYSRQILSYVNNTDAPCSIAYEHLRTFKRPRVGEWMFEMWVILIEEQCSKLKND
jgi:hypothetical protein